MTELSLKIKMESLKIILNLIALLKKNNPILINVPTYNIKSQQITLFLKKIWKNKMIKTEVKRRKDRGQINGA